MLESLESTTNHEDLIDIMQGFRRRFSKDLYQKIRKLIVGKKDKYFA